MEKAGTCPLSYVRKKLSIMESQIKSTSGYPRKRTKEDVASCYDTFFSGEEIIGYLNTFKPSKSLREQDFVVRCIEDHSHISIFQNRHIYISPLGFEVVQYILANGGIGIQNYRDTLHVTRIPDGSQDDAVARAINLIFHAVQAYDRGFLDILHGRAVDTDALYGIYVLLANMPDWVQSFVTFPGMDSPVAICTDGIRDTLRNIESGWDQLSLYHVCPALQDGSFKKVFDILSKIYTIEHQNILKRPSVLKTIKTTLKNALDRLNSHR